MQKTKQPKKKVLVLFREFIPHYREGILNELIQCNEYEFCFAQGNTGGDAVTVRPFSGNLQNTVFIKNYYFQIPFLRKRWFLWQSGLARHFLSGEYSFIIAQFSIYHLLGWILPWLCRVRNTPILSWTTVVSLNKRGFMDRIVRTFFYLPYNAFLLYGNKGKKYLMKSGFKDESCYVIYNSLNHDVQKKFRETQNAAAEELRQKLVGCKEGRLIFHSGRLVVRKRLEQLFQAMKLMKAKKRDVFLVLAGGGPLFSGYQKMINEDRDLCGKVFFLDEIYDEMQLARYIMASDLTVLPGDAGLAIIHSLTYGTPVLIHNGNNNGPEYEAVIENKTGDKFEENNPLSLAEKMDEMLFLKAFKKQHSNDCIQIVDSLYNPAYQKEVILQALAQVKADI